MTTMQIVWVALLVVFVVLEAATVALVSIWFCAGAVAALLVSLIWPGAIVVQVAAFLLVSAVTLLAVRPMTKKLVGDKKIATNADANIGKIGQVIEEVQPARFGRVKLEGLDWTAKSSGVLPVGTWCRVEAIEGVKLVVTQVENPNT